MKKHFLNTVFTLLQILLLYTHDTFALTLVPQSLSVNGHSIQLQVPSGLRVDFLTSLSSPRFLTNGPDSELLIGSLGSSIYRIVWPYSTAETLVDLPGLNHSIAYRNGNIYVAQTGGLHSAPYSRLSGSLSPVDFNLIVPLPSETGGHSTRTVIVGPDQRLYIGIGISGNCSDEYLHASYPFQLRRGGVYVLDESGGQSTLLPYAAGLRNPIGLAFYPWTNILYATNAGPDNLGYDQPPEVFAALNNGSFHGMPWFQFFNGQFRNGECATSSPPRPVEEATPPAVTFAARSTPEGIAFVTSTQLGSDFLGNGLVAIHGSWATLPGGGSATRRPPKISMVHFVNNKPQSVEDVVTGFQRSDGSRFARPCGMLMGPDGNLYFTSDSGEVTGLFRLSPTKPSSPEKSISSTYILLLENQTH